MHTKVQTFIKQRKNKTIKLPTELRLKMESPVVKKKGPPRGPAGTRSFYQVDTKGVCLLCLREIQRKAKGSKQVSSDFCKILLRYLKLDFHQNIVKPSKFKWKSSKVKKVGIELCQDCTLLATSFKEMYCQMELIQMRLNAYVKSISDIMRTAGRIPSRVKAYQEKMGIGPKKEQVGSTVGVGGSMTVATTTPNLFPKSALLAQNFRKELIQKTFESYGKALPRVKLTRSAALSAHSSQELLAGKSKVTAGKSSKSTAILTAPLSPFQTQFRNFLLAYSFSLATVWLLTTLKPGGKSVPDASVVPGNVNSSISLSLGAIEDTPISEVGGYSSTSPTVDAGNTTEQAGKQPIDALRKEPNNRRNSITITDSGKTVILPHQSFKTDAEFVDESIMEFEDNTDLIDLSDDGFFAQANSLIQDINMDASSNLQPEPETVKQEPRESVVDVNDRTCTECRIHLSSRAELEKHRSLIHKMYNHVQCPVCKNMFPSYHFLKNHRKESEACALDEATEALEFSTIAKPLFPNSSRVSGNRFCPMEGCFEVFLKQENLELHLKAHGLFSCSQTGCKEKFDKAHDLALHEARQHSEGGDQFTGYKCTRCNFHVGGQYQYILHFLGGHLNINVFAEQCSICQKGFIRKGIQVAKEIHFRTHHDVKGKDPKSVIKCDVGSCEAFFLTKSQLTTHKTHIHHIEQEVKLNCSVCGEKMLNQAVMFKHKLKAHSNLPAHEIDAKLKRKLGGPKKGKYKCMYCGNQYVSKYSLLIHSKVHDHLKDSVVPAEEENEVQKESEHLEEMQLEAQSSGVATIPENQ